MKTPSKKRLVLARQTVRRLQDGELAQANGGLLGTLTQQSLYDSCWDVCNTQCPDTKGLLCMITA